MTWLEDIGDALVDARDARGLTQRELAIRLGVHQQQIARWEQERYGCVSLSRIARVAEALGLEPLTVSLRDEGGEQPLMAAEDSTVYGAVVLNAPWASIATTASPVRDLGEIVARIRANAAELHESYGVTHIDVFGSFARGEQRPDSDIDLIVEVVEPTLETVFGSEERLARLLGRKVDAGSFRSLRPRVQPYVDRERVHVWSA